MTLDEFIRQQAQKDPKSRFKYLTITEQALSKAQAYARLVAEEHDNAECYGFLLTDADDEQAIVDDILLAPDQEVGWDSCKVTSEGIHKAGQEIRRLGKRCVGWTHSHSRFKPHHSHIDDTNFEVVLNQVGPANLIAVESEDLILEGDWKAELKDGALIVSGAGITLGISGNGPLEGIAISKLTLKTTQYISYAYSLVVNAVGDEPYAEIIVKRWGLGGVGDEVKSYEIELNVLYEHGEQLRQEIREKVKRKRWSWGTSWGWEDDDDNGEVYYRKKHELSKKHDWHSDW